MSLLVMIGAAHVPVHLDWTSIGWYVIRPTESISVDIVERRRNEGPSAGAPITRFDPVKKQDQSDGDKLDPSLGRTAEKGAVTESRPVAERLAGLRVFESAHNMPKIIGGIGAYYIHIEFPEEALLEGVQGRLILSFIVNTDGRTTGVEVTHSLHPACDSAAVRALRKTRFIPGRQDGEVVPVRMRLPVRFKIVDRDDGLATARDASG